MPPHHFLCYQIIPWPSSLCNLTRLSLRFPAGCSARCRGHSLSCMWSTQGRSSPEKKFSRVQVKLKARVAPWTCRRARRFFDLAVLGGQPAASKSQGVLPADAARPCTGCRSTALTCRLEGRAAHAEPALQQQKTRLVASSLPMHCKVPRSSWHLNH